MCVTRSGRCRSAVRDRAFLFNDTAATEIYTLSLHDALPISDAVRQAYEEYLDGWDANGAEWGFWVERSEAARASFADRKSTRLNSSHANTSYAVFCLKKKNTVFACSQQPLSYDLPRPPLLFH